eukprot:782747-Amphidinium_carterae.1
MLSNIQQHSFDTSGQHTTGPMHWQLHSNPLVTASAITSSARSCVTQDQATQTEDSNLLSIEGSRHISTDPTIGNTDHDSRVMLEALLDAQKHCEETMDRFSAFIQEQALINGRYTDSIVNMHCAIRELQDAFATLENDRCSSANVQVDDYMNAEDLDIPATQDYAPADEDVQQQRLQCQDAAPESPQEAPPSTFTFSAAARALLQKPFQKPAPADKPRRGRPPKAMRDQSQSSQKVAAKPPAKQSARDYKENTPSPALDQAPAPCSQTELSQSAFEPDIGSIKDTTSSVAPSSPDEPPAPQ